MRPFGVKQQTFDETQKRDHFVSQWSEFNFFSELPSVPFPRMGVEMILNERVNVIRRKWTESPSSDAWKIPIFPDFGQA